MRNSKKNLEKEADRCLATSNEALLKDEDEATNGYGCTREMSQMVCPAEKQGY